MQKPTRKFTERDLDKNRRDVLISGLAGRDPNQYENNVLPIHQYCGYTLVVPLADQPLDKYVQYYRENHKGNLMRADEMFVLAFQAARGLYQSHLYKEGKATTAHTDIKPSQFLLFEPPESGQKYPLLQLNDFNRCRLLERSKNGTTCPFRMCDIKHKGSTYRSPEEYMDCADQKDSVDVYSLGGIIFFLLSDGVNPYFDIDDYDRTVERILKGKLPRLPSILYYKDYLKMGDEGAAFVTKRAQHPAFLALQQIMLSCWKYEPSDRPSSLQVLKMFEAKAKEVLG
eukprot:scaffold114336_cov76-Cyclotella_meneghiniana.AAC.4